MKILALALSFMTIINSAFADDHLIPEDSVFTDPFGYNPDDYHLKVTSVFKEAYAPSVFARVIVIPSFWEEYAVAVLQENDVFKIIHLQPSHRIWDFELLDMYKSGEIRATDGEGNSRNDQEITNFEDRLPDGLQDITVDKCELIIPRALAETLYKLWAEMLFSTRYVDKRPVTLEGDDLITVGADGITYHFSFEYGIDTLNGKIWSPEENSLTGRFVNITDMMKQACLEENTALLADLQNEIDSLLSSTQSSAH